MKSSYNLEYKIVNLDNFNITFNIQKNIWPDDVDYDDIYDKATNTKEDNCLFLVYDNNILIGLTGVDVFEEYPDTIWLDWLAVLPEHRRKGYGEKILKDTIEYCTCLNKFKSFRVETTYYENRPALFLYDKIMQLKEEYTIEDKDKKHNTLIYSYPLDGKLEPWNNRYLGLREYYDNLDKKWRKYESINT